MQAQAFSIEAAMERAAEHYTEPPQKPHKNLGDVLAESWEAVSHVLVALFLVVAVALFLNLLETSAQVTDRAEPVAPRYGLAQLLGVPVARAASNYAAAAVSITPHNITLAPGDVQAVQVKIKNIGSQTWNKTGAGYLSFYTINPKYHPSPYRGSSWWSDHQFGQLVEARVAPGETGTMDFFVHAPQGFEGDLTETFALAAEETAWIDGGQITVTITVASEESQAALQDPNPVTVPSDVTGYAGSLLAASVTSVRAKADQTIPVQLAFKNTGTKAWSAIELHAPETKLAASNANFQHLSWISDRVAARLADVSVAASGTIVVDVILRAPKTQGVHTAQFQLVADGVELGDAVVNIPVTVTEGAKEVIDDPIDEDKVVRDGAIIQEPRVRVGIDQVTDEEVVFSANAPVRVVESDEGYERFTIPTEQPMRVRYNTNTDKYVFESGGTVHVADSYLRFEGENVDTIFTVASYSDVRSWNTSLNDNTFRDTLEVHHSAQKGRTWLINELPTEHYLYGVDESSNTAPEEYHKALNTAARTYALYMWEHKTKYMGEYIDVRSTTYDQVYHGYGAEIRRPNWVDRVKATAGTSIQYGGETIVAAYYSRSDGQTRDWADVWGREVPYAKSVAVPCEEGRTQWGHGVGMSAGGAVCFAEDGMTFDEILKYFYTGVELVRRW